MSRLRLSFLTLHFLLSGALFLRGVEALPDTFSPLRGMEAPRNHQELWDEFDPRREPLEVEVLRQWEDSGVELRVLRYRIGVFKGEKAVMAGVYGFPKGASNLPGLLQIHGGGQYADHQAPLTNAKRGYATLSIAWAGRISAPDYRVGPAEVELFWNGKSQDPKRKLTTDWGALDAYHAPSRYGIDAFKSIPVADWTLDSVESPRNNAWFLIAVGARRGLTFLERQPEVDASKLGVYGHSMGGKLTVLTAGSDERVKAAAPSCGGISDRYASNPLHLSTVSDPPSLRRISCPIVFLSPANDFHGRINDLPTAVSEIKSREWRLTCSPHHNHQDTPPYEVATQLWFDQFLKDCFRFPKSPEISIGLPSEKSPIAIVKADDSHPIEFIDVYYTQQGQVEGEKDDSENTKNRFWRYAPVSERDGQWVTRLPILSRDKPLWVYANVRYKLMDPVSAAGYYYGSFKADSFNLSSLPRLIESAELRTAESLESLKPSLLIEDFKGDWRKEWFSYNPSKWGLKTHKIHDPAWRRQDKATLAFEVKSEQPNTLVVGIDSRAVERNLQGGNRWTSIRLKPGDFKDLEGKGLSNWEDTRELRFVADDTLRGGRGSTAKSKKLGGAWKGKAPEFRNLRWLKN